MSTIVSYSQITSKVTSCSSKSVISIKHHCSLDASYSLHNFLCDRNSTNQNFKQVSTNSNLSINWSQSYSSLEQLLQISASLSVTSLSNIVKSIVFDIKAH